MLVTFTISLVCVQPLSESNRQILRPVNGSVITNVSNSMQFETFRSAHEQTELETVIYENETLNDPNKYFTFLSESTSINTGLRGTKTPRHKTVKPNETDTPRTVVTGEDELNQTIDDDWSVFNESFEGRAREDGYEITTAEQNPYSVMLIMQVVMVGKRAKAICTGSLLTTEWVLSAAHCVTPEKDARINVVEVYAGVDSLEEIGSLPATAQLLKSTEFYPHPNYELNDERDDVAVLKVDGRFQITKTVKLIRLATTPWTNVGYRTCKITGFGKVHYKGISRDDHRRKTNTLKVKNPCKCNFRLKQMYGNYPTKSYICAKPVKDYGICSGDSGGGLVCLGKVRATAMMIVKMYDTVDCDIDVLAKLECASDHALTVFLDVCPYLRWINSKVGLLDDEDISPECVEFSGQPRTLQASSLCVSAAIAVSLLSVCR